MPIVLQVNGSVTTTPLDERAPLTGSTDQVADDLAQLSALGTDHVVWSTVDTEPFDLTYTDLSGHARAGPLLAPPMSFRGSRRFTL